MELKRIFEKPVDRPIEGVIKADDDTCLKQEIEEYVFTNEIEKRLEDFFDAYINYQGANGAWISGFFGSGKSHLLKMLSLLLENRTIDGVSVATSFEKKCGDNEILRGHIKRSITIPSKSILFNIDQKADLISKSEVNALLAVFVKVFDEMCGYYGKQGHIAQFERDLDGRGLYEKFKKTYSELSGQDWNTGREQVILESDNIAKSYAKVTSSDPALSKGILDKYRSEYKVSIEDFANKVNDHIKKQVKDFRLNFFVDEVGQFIADNVKLMTNLQTIAESLATKSRGQAWIVVTAQDEMSTVVGEMDKQQGNDFSKIQARFNNRLKLTSADVAEVIQKRLLLKNAHGVEKLAAIYHEQANNLKTLFDFSDGTQSYKNFQDRDHFIRSYPFVPYQFTLFQSAIQNLSQHNAFEGKHSSVGERSMLAVFQQVAKGISDLEIGQLATFDLMFEGVRASLKSQIQRAVLNAEKNLGNKFAEQVLKALFLVKYVKEFKATVRNLCVLMLDNFNTDLGVLKNKVTEALNLLEQQTYIQRHGDEYEFLTDEEKDIEQEIKSTDVSQDLISENLDRIIFDGIIKERKIRPTGGLRDYEYSRKIDERVMGRDYEVGIQIISPFHEKANDERYAIMQSSRSDDLIVLLPADDRIIADLMMYLRTETYFKQNISKTQDAGIKRILNDKQFQNSERDEKLKTNLTTLLTKAKMFVAGREVEKSSENPQTRLFYGFEQLIQHVYLNLGTLRGHAYLEKDIGAYLKPQGGLHSPGEAELEVLNQINLLGQNNRPTVKLLIEKFEKKPYGWPRAAVLCVLAKLHAMDKIDAKIDVTPLEGTALEKALINSREWDHVKISPLASYTPSQINQIKKFYTDFFDGQPKSQEAKELGDETAQAFTNFYNEMEKLFKQAKEFPFLNALDAPLVTVKGVLGKIPAFYLMELSEKTKNELLVLKENIFDPVREFMSGNQKVFFQEASAVLRINEANFNHIDSDEPKALKEILDDPTCYKGGRIRQAKELAESLTRKVSGILTNEKEKISTKIGDLRERLLRADGFAKLTAEQKQSLTAPFEKLTSDINNQNLVAVIRDHIHEFETSKYPFLLTQLDRLAAPPAPAGSTPVKGSEFRIIPCRSLNVSFNKACLESEEDVTNYLKAFKEELMKVIKEKNKVSV